MRFLMKVMHTFDFLNQIFNIGIMFLFQEMYNNIVIYIVGHPPEESPSPNEMHIFQCVNVSARFAD